MSTADDVLGIELKPELHPLQEELLREQIRVAKLEADAAELEFAAKYDTERDRLVRVGRIRHLWINSGIGGANADKWMDALQNWERRDPGEPITIDINSPGGYVTDGLAIYDQIMRMRRMGHHVTTRGCGLVASMAAVIFQAGDVRIMDPRAKMLLHEGSAGAGGTIGQIEDAKAFIDMLTSDVIDILAERSTLSKRQLAAKWRRKDWWLTADEAVKFGFADKVE